MDVSKEEENFFRVNRLVYNCILPQLRTLFKSKWNTDYPQSKWCNSKENGEALLKMIKGGRRDSLIKSRISTGNLDSWDVSCVGKALLVFDTDATESERIKKLKDARNDVSHNSTGKCEDTEKDQIFKDVKDIYVEFGWPTEQVEKMQHETLTTEDVKNLKAKLEAEKRAALEEEQKNFCKLPPKVENFVGREIILDQFLDALDFESHQKFVMINGGPCFGKSSLAIQIGYELYDRGYNYIAWVNMRDMTKDLNSPTLGDVAMNILQKFNIDTSNMKDDIEECLRRKLKMISDCGKTALLIFDNADNLMEPAKDELCQSTTFDRLCQMIRETPNNSIRAVFTSRVCKTPPENDPQKVRLEHLSDEDSRKFFSKEFQNISEDRKATLIADLVKICKGLPYALKLTSSEVTSMDSNEMIEDYVNELKKSPVDELDYNSQLINLFDLSYRRLNQNERDVFTSLAVFPSGFSYPYLLKFGKNLDGINMRLKILQTLAKHSLVSFYEGSYLIHPFLRDFLQTKHWDDGLRVTYKTAYFKTYINQLFVLARESLEKDKYSQCLSEFQQEQQNFVYVMAAIGKKWDNCLSDLRETLKKLLTRPTPDYICVLLFYCHELYLDAVFDFFEGCETFVEGQMKKNVWCCRFDANLGLYEKQIDDIYNGIESDEYGKALVEKRKWGLPKNQSSLSNEFGTVISRLDRYLEWAKKLDDQKMNDYFTIKLLKVKVRLSKKVYKGKELKNGRERLLGYLKEALEISKESFGEHGLTVDCHTQLAKLYWLLQDKNTAKKWFERALEMAKSFPLRSSKRYLACLIDKGRLLIEFEDKESIEEGRLLLEDGIERCKDVLDEILRLLGLQSLVKVDRAKVDVIINHVLEKTRLFHPTLNAMHTAVLVALDRPAEGISAANFIEYETSTVEKIRKVIDHLERVCEQRTSDRENILQDAITKIYIWTMMVVTRCMHVLSQGDTRKYAEKALAMLDTHSFITEEKRKELTFILKCDKDRYDLMQKKCHLDQMAKRSLSMKNELDAGYNDLLKSCEKHEDVWSWAVRGLTRDNKKYFEKVTPYLLTQRKPSENLLELVLIKFCHQIAVGNRESRRDVIARERKAAVNHLTSAIEHVDSLLVSHGSEGSPCLEDALKAWYTNLAIKSKGTLKEEDRCKFARLALRMARDNDNVVTDHQKDILKDLLY